MSAIANATSLEQVVAIINAAAHSSVPYFGGTDLRSPEALAAEYAVDAADDADISSSALEAHLEYLEQAGALFDPTLALRYAIKMLIMIFRTRRWRHISNISSR